MMMGGRGLNQPRNQSYIMPTAQQVQNIHNGVRAMLESNYSQTIYTTKGNTWGGYNSPGIGVH